MPSGTTLTAERLEDARATAARGDLAQASSMLADLDEHDVDPRLAFEARALLADILVERGRFDEAVACLTRPAAAAPTAILGGLRAARMELSRGELDAARALLEPIERATGVPWMFPAMARVDLARIDFERGELASAIHRGTTALKAAVEQGYPDIGAAACLVAGQATAALGRPDEAVRFFMSGLQALDAARRSRLDLHGSPLDLAEVASALHLHAGLLLVELGQPEAAAEVLAGFSPDPRHVPLAELVSATLAAGRGDADAPARLAHAAAVAREHASPSLEVRALLAQAALAPELAAHRRLVQAAVDAAAPDSASSRLARFALAEIELAQGHPAAASRLLDALDAESLALGEQASIARLRALLALAAGDGDGALVWLEAALRTDEARQSPSDLARDHLLMASTLRRADAPELAAEHLERALTYGAAPVPASIEAAWQALVRQDDERLQGARDALLQHSPTPDHQLSRALAIAAAERRLGAVAHAPALLRQALAAAEANQLPQAALGALLALDGLAPHTALTEPENLRLEALLQQLDAQRQDLLAFPARL